MATKPLNEISKPIEFESEPTEIKQMRDEYSALGTNIDQQIAQIQQTEVGVDVNALTGELTKNLEETKGRMVESAMASVKKAGVDMDAYFGGATSDQRSSARLRMASSMKNNMMQGAFQAIAAVNTDGIKSIVSTQMEGAKINLQALATKSSAIAELTGQANQMYLGVLSAVNDNYQARLSASVKWAEIEATARGQDIAASLQREQMKTSERTALLTSANTPWWVKRSLAPPPSVDRQRDQTGIYRSM